MVVAIFISVAIMLAMMGVGLYLSLDWDPEARTVGLCTAVWVAIAFYLFLTQWLFVERHEMFGLVTITTLSTAGYIVGKTLSAIARKDPTEVRNATKHGSPISTLVHTIATRGFRKG
jgi:hypothetical protein